eukprot:scaffold34664_cov240-Amphora_coffeaeformis.AAC.8
MKSLSFFEKLHVSTLSLTDANQPPLVPCPQCSLSYDPGSARQGETLHLGKATTKCGVIHANLFACGDKAAGHDIEAVSFLVPRIGVTAVIDGLPIVRMRLPHGHEIVRNGVAVRAKVVPRVHVAGTTAATATTTTTAFAVIPIFAFG